MERTYLQFSVINTITVVLMAATGVILLGVIAATLKTYTSQGEVA